MKVREMVQALYMYNPEAELVVIDHLALVPKSERREILAADYAQTLSYGDPVVGIFNVHANAVPQYTDYVIDPS